MSIIESIGTMLSNGISGTVGGLAKDIRTAITGKEAITSAERQKVLDNISEMEKLTLQADQAIMAGQLRINEVEAASSSLFKGGWRPAVGWTCVLALLYTFLIRPLLPWGVTVITSLTNSHFVIPELPVLDMGSVIALLGGMLGLGGFRTFEKVKGIS
jgi:hypothetical protein